MGKKFSVFSVSPWCTRKVKTQPRACKEREIGELGTESARTTETCSSAAFHRADHFGARLIVLTSIPVTPPAVYTVPVTSTRSST